jgi:AraC-like DNA-binding protein
MGPNPSALGTPHERRPRPCLAVEPLQTLRPADHAMHSPLDRLRQRLDANARLAWHSHADPYAALVLDGDYEECGDGGRRRVGPGHLVIHPPFSAHANVVGRRGATVVNLPLTVAEALTLRSGVLSEPEAVVHRYMDDPVSVSDALRSGVTPVAQLDDIPDRLAAALALPGRVAIAEWGAVHGISARSVTRHFSAALGLPPAQFRWRARTHGALRALITTARPLVEIAHDWGFSDQAHMTRSIRRLTGRSPTAWRATVSD